MSIPTILHVFNHSKAKKSHRLVLLEIANHVNDKNGLAWPSYAAIARRTGLSRRWVIDIVADLASVGELRIHPNGGPDGEQAYSIPTGELTSPPPAKTGELTSPPSELSSYQVVNSLHPNLNILESLLRKKSAGEGEGERRLTKVEAVKLGLTPGSRLFRFITGQSDE